MWKTRINFLGMPGYLALYCGPMFSGKTSKLLTLSMQFDKASIKNVIINHASDTRYSDKSELVSHDGRRKDCVLCSSLYDYQDPTKSTPVEAFFINEAQFFNDVVSWTHAMVNQPNCKRVYVSGLDADYKRSQFGNWLELLPFADTIEKLASICSLCKVNSSVFSLRLEGGHEQVQIGSFEYAPVCRACYENNCLK